MLSPFSSVSAGGTTENVLTSLTPPLTRAKTTARNDPDRNDGLAGARASLIPAPAPPGADARGHRVRGRAERGPAMGGVGVRFRRLEWLEASRQQPPDSCARGANLAFLLTRELIRYSSPLPNEAFRVDCYPSGGCGF